MVRSGSFGNSGVQQMQQESQRQLQQSLGRAASDLRYNDYQFDQNFGRQLFNDAFGQQQQQFQNGLGLLGLVNQTNGQDLGAATNIQNTPLNYWQTFANQANGFGQGYGTASSSTQMPGSPLLGAVGGYQLGGAIAKNWNTPSDWSGNWGNAMKTNGLPGFDSPYG
jgi:hypothetical protein